MLIFAFPARAKPKSRRQAFPMWVSQYTPANSCEHGYFIKDLRLLEELVTYGHGMLDLNG